MFNRTFASAVALVVFLAVGLPAQTRTFPVDELKAGMVGIGRTVFEGDQLEEFKVHILGVLRNVIGTRRNLILARLEGGPLANTGVIAGMSGSPVYIDGRLLGAVSYSLGQFSKEPIAGITPIDEMTDAATFEGPRRAAARVELQMPLTPDGLRASLREAFSWMRPFADTFYGLGPTRFPMTRAHVLTVLPSLASSMKIASTGDVIGTVQQDRATTIAGTLGPGPSMIPVRLSLTSERGTKKTFQMAIVNDQLFTPMLAYLSILNTLSAYERQNGTASYVVRGSAVVKDREAVAFENLFTGDQSSAGAAAYVVAPINFLLRNAFEDVELGGLNLEIDASEEPRSATIERVWVDGGRPKPGAKVELKVLFRTYRGEEITRTLPLEIPPSARGALSVMVSDGTRLSQ